MSVYILNRLSLRARFCNPQSKGAKRYLAFVGLELSCLQTQHGLTDGESCNYLFYNLTESSKHDGLELVQPRKDYLDSFSY